MYVRDRPYAIPATVNGFRLPLRKRLLAAALSALVPGSGQLILGKRREGIAFGLVFLCLLFCFWPLRLLHSYWNLIWMFWMHLTLVLSSAFRAFYLRCGIQSSQPSPARAFLVLAVGLVGLNIALSLSMSISGFRAFQIPSTSMEDTLAPGDHVPGGLLVLSACSAGPRGLGCGQKNRRFDREEGDCYGRRHDPIPGWCGLRKWRLAR